MMIRSKNQKELLISQSVENNYQQIFNTTIITGATNVSEILLKLIKSKIIAVKAGPQGIGLFGILMAVVSLISTIFSFGITTSAIKTIAQHHGINSKKNIYKIAKTIRYTSFILGLIGSVFLILFNRQITTIFAKEQEHSIWLLILAPTIFFNALSGSNQAILRGTRKIKEIVKIRISSTIFATAVSVPIIWFFQIKGIAWAILTTSLLTFLISTYITKKTFSTLPSISTKTFFLEAKVLLLTGLPFLATGIQSPLIESVTRSIILYHTNLNSVGQFLAAVAFSHTYVNFILQALALDLLPRLASRANNLSSLKKAINEEFEMVVLLAMPGVISLILLGKIIVPLFYSSRFDLAITILQWHCLGVLFKVASWPIIHGIVAARHNNIYFLMETMRNFLYLVILTIMTHFFGLIGAALAYAAVFAIYFSLINNVAKKIICFNFSDNAKKILITSLIFCIIAFFLNTIKNVFLLFLSKTIIFTLVMTWSFLQLKTRITIPSISKLKTIFRRQ